MRSQQPGIGAGALRGLQVVDPVEAGLAAAAAATADQPPSASGPGRSSTSTSSKYPSSVAKSAKGAGGQQGDPVGRMPPADRGKRPERLDEIAERAEPDDQDAPARLVRRPLQLLERGENRGMRRDVRVADGGGEKTAQRAPARAGVAASR